VDGALGGDADVAAQTAHQQLANLACTPMWLLLLEGDDLLFDWSGSWLAYRIGRRDRSVSASSP